MLQLHDQCPFEVSSSLANMGQRIRIARTRRRISSAELAQSSLINRKTLYRIEQGDPAVSFATVLKVLWALGLLDTLNSVAHPDADDHGKILEQAALPQRVRTIAVDNDF